MTREELEAKLAKAIEKEKQTIHQLGIVLGYEQAIREVLAESDTPPAESDRKVVPIATGKAETTSRNPGAEKR